VGVITKNEARQLLANYQKWDITGEIEGGDKPIEETKLKAGSSVGISPSDKTVED